MESRLKSITAQLTNASHSSDESEKLRKQFEMQGIDDDEKIGNLEKSFLEAQAIADEADKRYDEVTIHLFTILICESMVIEYYLFN